MEIKTSRLQLNEISWDDLDHVHHLHTIAEVDEFNTLGIPESLDETREVIRPAIEDQSLRERRIFMWKIIERKSGAFAGICGLTLSRDRFRTGEIYFKLKPSFWGRGLATEIAKALVKAGFEYFKLHRVEAGVATGNVASIRVLEKIGMIREGTKRKILPIRGEWHDNYHYAIVEDDPREY